MNVQNIADLNLTIFTYLLTFRSPIWTYN